MFVTYCLWLRSHSYFYIFELIESLFNLKNRADCNLWQLDKFGKILQKWEQRNKKPKPPGNFKKSDQNLIQRKKSKPQFVPGISEKSNTYYASYKNMLPKLHISLFHYIKNENKLLKAFKENKQHENLR